MDHPSETADLAIPGLDIPEGAIRYVWAGALAGFPLALLFAWRYQLTPVGIVRTAPREDGDDATLPLRRLDHFILISLLLVAGAGAFQLAREIRQAPAPIPPGAIGPEILPNTIAVLPLQNVTGDPEQEFFVAGIHDALITTLPKVGALTVKAASSTNVYRNIVQPARRTGLELGTARCFAPAPRCGSTCG